MKGQQLVDRIVELVQEKLGEDILVLDLREQSPLADWFVVVTAGSTVHAQAIGEELLARLRAEGQRAHHVEGVDNGHWILLDYFDVVVHILLSDVRQFYGLERLWGDAPRRTYEAEPQEHPPANVGRRVTGGDD
jgi:ribosome-associated protein